MKQGLISVIIPAYNVEKYIEKCVNSVVKQTWNNIEIIIIDDGSTDTTGEICDRISNAYDNVRVIHQKNEGLSVARNTGIDNCNGEWIAFLDSDDWVEPEMYEVLYNLAVDNNVDISSCLSRDIVDGEEIPSKQEDYTIHKLNHYDIINGLLTEKMMRFEVWNKLWRKDFIGDTRFVKGQVAEDVHFDRILFERAGEIVHINRVLHNYLITRPGNTNSSFKVARLCIFDEFKQWKTKLEAENNSLLANIVSAIAANFAVDIFCNAARAKQEEDTLDFLRDSFLYFYDNAIKAKMRFKRRIKLFLFKMWPRILCN